MQEPNHHWHWKVPKCEKHRAKADHVAGIRVLFWAIATWMYQGVRIIHNVLMGQ